MKIRRLSKVLLIVSLIVLVFVLFSNLWVVLSTRELIYHEPGEMALHEVAIVLGTSNKISDGTDNPFFISRIDAAVELYKAGKVKYLIVSGDNRSKYYNEPLKMQQALIARGIPKNVITLDYAGLRTLDSVIRCKEVFGQQDVVIISQGFHCYRALFISDFYDMDAIAYATKKLTFNQSYKVVLREVLARPVAIWDTYFIAKKPKHLGKSEPLNRGDI
jgi:SanA protein